MRLNPIVFAIVLLLPVTGCTSVHDAIVRGDRDAIRSYLEKGGNPNAVNSDGFGLLHVAAIHGDLSTIDLLLDQGARIDARRMKGVSFLSFASPLFYAAQCGRSDVVGHLLERGARVQPSNQVLVTPLQIGVYRGHLDVVKTLLTAGADVNAGSSGFGQPLLLATRGVKSDVLRELLLKGASVRIQDRNGNTPLHLAAELACPDSVRLLLAHEAHPNAKNKDGQTPLHMVARTASTSLLRLRADPYGPPRMSFPSLGNAALARLEVARLLLNKEANPRAQDKNGQTPLQVAEGREMRNLLEKSVGK